MASRYRYVTPVDPARATGLVARVYAQIDRDFPTSRPPTMLTLSPAPRVLAAAWALLRESLFAGDAPRLGKEAVAGGVSLANRCPFCVDAHSMLVHGLGDRRLAEAIARDEIPDDPGHARLVAWGKATRTPSALPQAPFPAAHAPEYLGTALAFHFINRIVSALLTPDVLPGNAQRSAVVRAAAGRALSRAIRRRVEPGASLPLLAGSPQVPAWAGRSPVGIAFAALRAEAGDVGDLLSAGTRAVIRDSVAFWDGDHPSFGSSWLDAPLWAAAEEDVPAARIVLLTALAPYRLTDSDVAAWRAASPGRDADLVRLVAFGALTAVEHVEAGLTRAPSAA
ncbi:carboxymuconolactone decarboxylase family protein [Bailinhaonella thermotolerans]|uniref:DNA-binding protein n=1 Tax=Bailinhaonella thermotolerans TaxID=1070861 RepID=A0A3A4AMT5_9ACTN|nr:carboxymuconolactone decarboxylase family protein [Bailinhaonella thermotolerans]RJL30996.1 DNA-binding protein [Bailinhaonella thermotolerans]